jgi:hypothetical protein
MFNNGNHSCESPPALIMADYDGQAGIKQCMTIKQRKSFLRKPACLDNDKLWRASRNQAMYDY